MSDDPKAPRNPGGIRPDPDGPPEQAGDFRCIIMYEAGRETTPCPASSV